MTVPVILSSHLESIYSLLFAYFAFLGETPGYTDLRVLYAAWHTRGNL